MSRYYMYFTKTKFKKTTDGTIIPESYSFWPELIKHFINRCTNFRIDCWSNEYEAIERAQRFGTNLACEFDNIKVFEGCITQEFIDELIHNPFDSTGKIRWFSIFLMNGEERVLNCEHYGSELITGWLEPGDIEFLKGIMPDDFIAHIFEEDRN